ncbi:MAG: LapA family protein [Pseudomonadales bacterium]|nr:LapA family protein [Pseudomonadales bacterium]
MRRLWAWWRVLMLVLLFVVGLWMVVVNAQPIDLNLLFWKFRSVNSGLAMLCSFLLGSLIGMLVGLNLYVLFKLKGRVFLLRRELRDARQQLERRTS